MAIETREDYRRYLRWDLAANNLVRWRYQDRFRRPEVYYQRVLRRVEFLMSQGGPAARVERSIQRARLMRLSVLTGISIPPGVFGPGLSIAHYGSIVVHSQARVGAFCRINSATNIGVAKGGVPTIGDFVYISPGAIIYGPVKVGDRAVIGANAVVGRDVPSAVIVAGAPARVISANDSSSVMPEWFPAAEPPG